MRQKRPPIAKPDAVVVVEAAAREAVMFVDLLVSGALRVMVVAPGRVSEVTAALLTVGGLPAALPATRPGVVASKATAMATAAATPTATRCLTLITGG